VSDVRGEEKGRVRTVAGTHLAPFDADAEPRMLDAYVIDEIKRRERGQQREDRPVVELPVPPRPERAPSHEKEDDGGRPGGVVIIDYS
jgi:hypothetical protein